MSSEYSGLNPSGAHRWINCPGSFQMCKGIPYSTSPYAEEGKKAHEYAAWLLTGAKPPAPFEADREMVSYVSVYTNAIRQAAEGKILLVERDVDVRPYTGRPDGHSYVDAAIIDLTTGDIEVHDLKYGQGHMVEAENNEQLMLYGLGFLDIVESLFCPTVKNVKLVIHQPRRDHISEWTVGREELVAFGDKARLAGAAAIACKKGDELHPSASACLWCPAKAVCPALATKVHDAVFDQFDAVKPVSEPFPSAEILDLIEGWVSAVRESINAKLQSGEAVPGWKLVMGRKGNKAWTDEAAAETLIRAMRIKLSDAFTEKLKTPTQLEKIIPEKKWLQLAALVSQSDSKPVMAAESDKRQAVQPAVTTEDFGIFA